MKKPLTRRQLISSSARMAATLGPATRLFLPALMNGIFSSHMAHAQSVLPRRYVGIFLNGAPMRAMYDVFLDPYNSGNFISYSHFGNAYKEVNGRYETPEYRFWSHNGMALPWMWQFPVASSAGGTRPVTDLLPHLLSLQGITTENAGHPGSQLLHSLHTAGRSSIAALPSEKINRDIPAIHAGSGSSISGFGWKSPAGKELSRLSGPNYLSSLMAPFTRTPNTILTRALANSSEIEGVLDLMNEKALAGDLRAKVILDSTQGTKSMMARASEPLTTIWDGLISKYTDLIARSIVPASPIPGLTDLPIGISSMANRATVGGYKLDGTVLDHSDLRTLIGPTTGINLLAETFAIAEYLIERDLTYSIVLNPSVFNNLYGSSGSVSALGHGFDEHFTGIMPVIYLNTMYFRAMSACLLEFIDRLKAFGVFNDTVIDMSQDFHRTPDKDGSDHGFNGKSVAFYSGSITNGPFIRGHTEAYHKPTGKGSWGAGAQNRDTLGNNFGLLKIPHVHATMAYLLRANNPITTANSVVELNAGTLTSILEPYKLLYVG